MSFGKTWEAIAADLRAQIPEHLRPGLVAYIDEHRPTGGFLRAVLENDLGMAALHADSPETWAGVPAIVRYLDHVAPQTAFGSPARVRAWLAERPGRPE